VTGNIHERWRDQRPTMQRFLQNDPLGIGGGDTNYYRTEANNSITGTDPTGLDEFWLKSPLKTAGIIGSWVWGVPFGDMKAESTLESYGKKASERYVSEVEGINPETGVPDSKTGCKLYNGGTATAKDAVGKDFPEEVIQLGKTTVGTMILVGSAFLGPEDLIASGLAGSWKLGIGTSIKGRKFLVSLKTGKALTEAEKELLVAEYNLIKAGKGVAGKIESQIHHIAPFGGAKGRKFRELFESIGSCAETDPLNKMVLPGHKGGHIDEYYDYVYRRLSEAVDGITELEARQKAFYKELAKIREKLIEDPRLPYSDGGLRK